MDSPRQYKEPKSNREAKRSQNYSSTPPQKDAYARLLSQHHSSKFRSYLEQYSLESSVQGERNGPSAPLRAHSERLDIPQRKRDPAHIEFSDSSDFSPSSMKSKGGDSLLSSYMEACDSRQDSGSGKPCGVDAQQRGDRRDTATSHDGDVDSSEEYGVARQGDSQKMKNIDWARSPQTSPKDGGSSGQEQERKKLKKKSLPKDHEREIVGDEVTGSAVNTAVSRPRSPHAKAKKTRQPQDSNADFPADKSTKTKNRGPKKQVFESYMSLEEVSHGLKKGELIQGPIRINPKNFQEAFIPSPDGLWDIFLEGIFARNRALNGDLVVVRILPREQWKVVKSDTDCEGASESDSQPGQASHRETMGKKNKPQQRKAERAASPDVIVEDQFSDQDELVHRVKNVSLSAAEGSGRFLEDPSPPPSNGEILQKTAKVVYIVERKHSRAVTGFLKFLPDKPFAMFSPADHRVPRINVPLDDCPLDFSLRSGDYANMLFICRITSWSEDSSFAQGRLAKSLGQAGQIEPETEGILVEYDIDFSDFSDEVLACLPQDLPWTIPSEEMRRRRDLRQECIFTIDPATARDLDDALSCKLLPDGNFEVGVHIADVSYFLEEGNALDAIASRRATSVYLVQKVIPMLPRLLCEELCSLNPLTDRLTFSVIWKMTPQGKILSEWFGRSVIRSCAKLSYDHAQSMIDAPDKLFSAEELPPTDPEHPIDEIHLAVLNLHAIAKSLRAQRFEGGALRLDQLKLSFTLDKETMMPQGCYVYEYRDSNKLVEELMLLANMATAHQIYRSFPEQALLRRHPPPQTKMVDELQEFCDQMGLDIDLSSAGALHRSLHATLGDDEYAGARKEVLTNMCSRPMQMALYFCTGVVKDEALFKHYALNVPFYTHFTSPIRRYADVIVHRLLAASLGCGRRLGLTGEGVHKQASRCNDKKTASKRVQELSSELFFGVFVKECGPLESEAMVMAVLDQSFDVLVLRYGVQKRLYCKAVAGVKTFHHQKVGRKGELTLVWAQEGPQKPSVQQVISVFTLVEVQLRAEGPAMKYSAVLMRPQGNAS